MTGNGTGGLIWVPVRLVTSLGASDHASIMGVPGLLRIGISSPPSRNINVPIFARYGLNRLGDHGDDPITYRDFSFVRLDHRSV